MLFRLHVSMETLTVGLLPRGPHALKDASLPHGVELFDSVVLLVEVSVGLFPGLRHCVLSRWRKVWSQFTVKSRHRHKSHFIQVLTSFQRHLEWLMAVMFPPHSSAQFRVAQLERYAHYRCISTVPLPGRRGSLTTWHHRNVTACPSNKVDKEAIKNMEDIQHFLMFPVYLRADSLCENRLHVAQK